MNECVQQYKASIIVVFTTIILALFSSCSEEKQETVNMKFDVETIPMMDTDSLTMLISDSGLIRYKVIAETWQFFERAKDPHWYFPKGMYVEQFDTLFRVDARLKADTVWNFTQRKLWRLKGHVYVVNSKGETFKSDELFWDERSQKVYTDKYIEIQKPGELMLKGKGLTSNQQMTNYQIKHPFDSDFYVDEKDENPIP